MLSTYRLHGRSRGGKGADNTVLEDLFPSLHLTTGLKFRSNTEKRPQALMHSLSR